MDTGVQHIDIVNETASLVSPLTRSAVIESVLVINYFKRSICS